MRRQRRPWQLKNRTFANFKQRTVSYTHLDVYKRQAQERAARGELLFGTMDTWLLWKLSQGAKHMSDVSNASRTMLMDLKTLDYDEELLKLWNIPRCMLPEIHDTSEVYGYTLSLIHI